MKEKLLSFSTRQWLRLYTLLALVVTSVSASAAVDWKTFETEKTYSFSTSSETYYQYTPSEDGVLYIYYSAIAPGIYDQCDDNGPVKGYINEDGSFVTYDLGRFSWYRQNYNGTFYTSQKEVSVKAGTTYYILAPESWSGTFIGHFEDVNELKLTDQNFESGKVFDITDTRYGQLVLDFNLNATADQWAYLKVGNYPSEDNKEAGRIETRSNVNTGSLIFNLKDSLVSWMNKGYFTGGETLTLSITGIHAKTDESIKYGTDGSLTLSFIAPGKGHKLVSSSVPDPLYSYYAEGDTAALLKLAFDYPVATGADQQAKVTFNIGYAEQSDAYQELLSSDKISANGDTLIIDFSGKLRSFAAMGLKSQYSTCRIVVTNVTMADGTMASTDGAHAGSYSFSNVFFEEVNYGNIKPEFTPANGETLTSDLKVYFSDAAAYSFTGVRFTYQDANDHKYQYDVTEGITSETSGRNGIEYTIPLTDAIINGKNVRLSFLGLTSTDGIDHGNIAEDVKFNPGDELTADLLPTASTIADGAVTTTSAFVLTFGENTYIHTPEGRQQAIITDLTTGKVLPLKAVSHPRDLKKVQVTSTESLKTTHKYSITINEAVIVNEQYDTTGGKYGKYMPENTWTFTYYKNKGAYDFITDPIEGSTLNEISTIRCTSDPSKSEDTDWIGYNSGKGEAYEAWALQINGTDTVKVQQATLTGGDNNDGFVITFDPAITEPGTYTICLGDSVYSLGTGYNAEVKDSKVYFSYNVIEAPTAEISVTADPESESTLQTLSTIRLTADETIYVNTTPVTVYNRAERKSYTATLAADPTNGNMAVITLDKELTAEENAGDYTIDIPSGVFGDQTWYDNDLMTGRTNEPFTLYYTLGDETPEGSIFTTDPEAGSTVASLQHIVISVGDGTTDYMPADGKVSITAPDGTVIYNDDPSAIWPDNWDDPVYQYEINLDEAATTPGVYTMTIPDGYFLDSNGEPVTGTTITWTIEGDTPDTNIFTTDPADGSTVASLQHIVISIGDGATDYMSADGKVSITAPDGTVIYNDDPSAIWPDNWDDPVYQYEINLDEAATTPGVYTMTIPDGYFLDCNGDPVNGTTITWTVSKEAGINSVTEETTDGKAYTISGIRVDAKTAKGLIIIGGKKVLKK